MKKIVKRILVIIAIVLATGSIILNGITLTKNSKLNHDVTTLTQEKEKIEEELRLCGEEKVQLEEKVMVLEGEATNKDNEIAELKKQVEDLKKK